VKLFPQRAPDGRYEVFISGGLLDGDRYYDENLDELLEGAVGLVQIADRAEVR